MRILDDPKSRMALVILLEDVEGHEFMLTDDIIVDMAPDGRIIGLDIMNTAEFGTPFDEAAAERAVAWVRERLAANEAS